MKTLQKVALISLLFPVFSWAASDDEIKYKDLSDNLTVLNDDMRENIAHKFGENAAQQYDVENNAWKILVVDYCKAQPDKTQCHIEATSTRIEVLKTLLEEEVKK